jgi:hypothetical protein
MRAAHTRKTTWQPQAVRLRDERQRPWGCGG